MKLILDCGGSTTKAAIIQKNSSPTLFTSEGINLNLETEENLVQKIKNWEISEKTKFTEIQAYVAGVSPVNTVKLQNALKTAKISTNKLFIESDLLAAARAGLGRQKGIISILGTGSNSGCYDGNIIKYNIPPLGFLLGDEASGFVIGKAILNNHFRQKFNDNLILSLNKYIKLNLNVEYLADFYNQAYPQKKIAQVCTWAMKHKDEPQISEIIIQEFDTFFQQIISNYRKHSQQLAFIGSIAFHFQEFIKPIAQKYNFELLSVQQNSIEGLIKFHK